MFGLENETLFESMRPGKALAKMALPTIDSQLIILIYNLADTWFIGRTNNPYMIGDHVVNYMNAVNKGKISFALAIVRHLVLIVPLILLMNSIWNLSGLIWSQLVADAVNAVITWMVFRSVNQRMPASMP